jgi:hypothetical protein
LRVFIALAFTAAFAAETDPRPIPAQLAADFYYAQAKLIQAQRDFDDAAGSLQVFCGDKATVTPSARDPRRLVCSTKPEAPK